MLMGFHVKQVWRHRIGTDPESDELVYHEEDESFYMSLSRSRSNKLIFIDISAPLPPLGNMLPLPHVLSERDLIFNVPAAQHHRAPTMQDPLPCSVVGATSPVLCMRCGAMPCVARCMGRAMPRSPACMRAGSSITSETMFLDADAPDAPARTVLPRRSDHECMSSHRGDHLISVLRDPKKPNSEVVVSPVADPGNTTARPPAELPALPRQPGIISQPRRQSKHCKPWDSHASPLSCEMHMNAWWLAMECKPATESAYGLVYCVCAQRATEMV